MKKGVILVLGEDRFRAREAVARLTAGDVDLSRYRGEKTSPAAVLDELKTQSLFGKPRVVLVEDAHPLLEGDSLAAFAEYAASPAAGSRLVLQSVRLDGRLKAAKALKERATVIACKPLPENQMPAWIGQRARDAYGLTMPSDAVRALLGRVGEDLGLLDSALVRLRDQIMPRTEVTPADVVESTEEHRSPILFEAANALQERDLAKAIAAVEAAFHDGIRIRQDIVTDPKAVAPILLGNLHGAYRNLLRYHMNGGDARSLGLQPGPAYHLARKAGRHRFDRLVRRHRLFVDADLALKRSKDQPRRIIEHLLVGLLGDA